MQRSAFRQMHTLDAEFVAFLRFLFLLSSTLKHKKKTKKKPATAEKARDVTAKRGASTFKRRVRNRSACRTFGFSFRKHDKNNRCVLRKTASKIENGQKTTAKRFHLDRNVCGILIDLSEVEIFQFPVYSV